MLPMNKIQRRLDLRSVESDPEVCAAVFTARHVGTLIANRGSIEGQPDVVDALHQPESEALLTRAVETIQKTTHFLSGWYMSCEV
jgi:hypothetical protein